MNGAVVKGIKMRPCLIKLYCCLRVTTEAIVSVGCECHFPTCCTGDT